MNHDTEIANSATIETILICSSGVLNMHFLHAQKKEKKMQNILYSEEHDTATANQDQATNKANDFSPSLGFVSVLTDVIFQKIESQS